MRKFFVLFGLVLLAATSAKAQEGPNFEVSGDYQFIRMYPGNGAPANNCQGFGGNAAVGVNNWLGVVGDFGFCKVTGLPSTGGVWAHNINYLFGPRVSFRNYGRMTPYVQFLLGGDRASAGATGFPTASSNAFAFSIGGGADVRLTPHVSFRAIQFEYLNTHFNNANQKNLRIETGLVYRFGGK